MNKGTLKQILLITDGCSNHGEDPVAISALAKEKGISVNVIGILSQNETYSEHGLKEVEEIAMSGGGISQIVYASQLSQTVKMVTQKAMTQTIHGLINKELTQILGEGKQMEDLPPDKRGEVMEVVDEMGETVDLEVLILVDISASMDDKLPTVQESLLDLSISLNSRTGNNLFAIYAFPGKREPVEKLMDWDTQLESVVKTFKKISTGGITPTGPALREALELFSARRSKRKLLGGYDEYVEESGS